MRPKINKQTVTTKKLVATAIARNTLKANGPPLMPTRCCLARLSFPWSRLHILIEISFSSWTACLRRLPFPWQKHRCLRFCHRICRHYTCQITAPGAYCRQRATLKLTQKVALWIEPFGNCELTMWGDCAVKLPFAQAALEENCCSWQWP